MDLLNVWPEWVTQRLGLLSHGEVQLQAPDQPDDVPVFGPDAPDVALDVVDGVAMIQITGFLQKHVDFFSALFGARSIGDMVAQIEAAANDGSVNSTLLLIDSPGGTAAGMTDLADAIFDHRAVKPIVAYIWDMAASGGYYAASQTDRIVIDRDGIAGSIGTFIVLPDTSAAAAAEGVKVHVIKSAPFKGDDVPGTVVTDATLDDMQRLVTDMAAIFIADVARGRGDRLPLSKVQTLADGRVHIGQHAVDLGLADEVGTIKKTLDRLRAGSIFGNTRRGAA